jgi:mechanosensitive ion channel-like protein
VDLRERHQQDTSARARRVRIKARPWRSIFAALIAIAGAIAARGWGARSLLALKDLSRVPTQHPISATQQAIFLTGFAAFVIFGLVAAVGLSSSARSAMQPVIGQAHAGVVRYVVLLAGVFAWLSIVLALVGVPARQLLTAGAVGGVLLGIAAQQSLGNLFAGLVLLFARPFRVGDHVRFRAGALSGTIEGYVTDLSLTYVRMQTDEGPVLLPNAQALAAAVLLVPEPPGGATADPPPDALASAAARAGFSAAGNAGGGTPGSITQGSGAPGTAAPGTAAPGTSAAASPGPGSSSPGSSAARRPSDAETAPAAVHTQPGRPAHRHPAGHRTPDLPASGWPRTWRSRPPESGRDR